MIRRYSILGLVTIAVVLPALFFTACGGGGGSNTKTTTSLATVNVTLSDPATCSDSTGGPFSHIYVTVTDVQINASATAGDNDANWIDLTPNLKSAPQQVDLLGVASNQCFLASLGSNTALQPGAYQQIRILLADNSVNVSGNKCGAGTVNCVVLSASPAAPQPLLLSSESRTGMKIPSGQIAGGQFTIAAGQTKDLNLDFDACSSIITRGNGQFRLKPVLHAGEVSLTSSSINGKLVDQATSQPISGGKAIVALEQKDATGVDRVVMQTTPDSTGAFTFCPVPAGAYDVVAVAVNGSNVAFAASITTGVQPGTSIGNVPMTAVTGASTAPATLTGDVTTASASTGGVADDVALSALQQVTAGSTTTSFTIPVGAQSAVLSVTTEKPASCTSTTCPNFSATYSMSVPPINPTVGAFASTGTSYAPGAAGNASYIVQADAFVPESGGTSDCNPSRVTSAATSVTAGTSTMVPTLTFVGCQ